MLRFFVSGLRKFLVRRTIRGMARKVRLSRGPNSDVDGLIDELLDQIDLMEALEIVGEIPSIIANAREAAAGAAVGTFIDLMENYNPGQLSLAENYCMPYAEEYWASTDSPDPSDYQDGMYGLHEGIENALSVSVTMSYEAARATAIDSLLADISVVITETLIARLTGADMAEARRQAWENFTEKMRGDELLGLYRGDGWISRGGRHGSFADTMFIGDRMPSSLWNGTQRQLSGRQFMGIDQPYWHTEGRSLQYSWMRGEIDYDTYNSSRSELYKATYNNPWSTTAPSSGYQSPTRSPQGTYDPY